MQWLTPIRGTPRERESILAAVATVLRHGPSPGPWEKAIPSISEGFNSFFFCLCKEFFDNACCILCMVLGGFPGVDSAGFGFIGLCDLGNNLGLGHDCGTQVPGSAFDSKDKRVFQAYDSPSSPSPLLAVTAFDNTGEILYTFAFLRSLKILENSFFYGLQLSFPGLQNFPSFCMLSCMGSGENRLFSSFSVNSSRMEAGMSKSGGGGVSVSSSSSSFSGLLNPEPRKEKEQRSKIRIEITYSLP